MAANLSVAKGRSKIAELYGPLAPPNSWVCHQKLPSNSRMLWIYALRQNHRFNLSSHLPLFLFMNNPWAYKYAQQDGTGHTTTHHTPHLPSMNIPCQRQGTKRGTWCLDIQKMYIYFETTQINSSPRPSSPKPTSHHHQRSFRGWLHQQQSQLGGRGAGRGEEGLNLTYNMAKTGERDCEAGFNHVYQPHPCLGQQNFHFP